MTHTATEYRLNPFGDPVIVATSRDSRPRDAKGPPQPVVEYSAERDPNCPFCAGNEAQTPPEVAAFRDANTGPDTAGWTVRVVPNKYPALSQTGGNADYEGDSLTKHRRANGRHEVVIHTTDHSANLNRLTDRSAVQMLAMWKSRLDDHRSAGWAATTTIINQGREAGASLAHPHGQMFATDIVPPRLEVELIRQDEYAAANGTELLADVVAAETGGERFVDAEGDLIAWAPYWSQTPFETWISLPERDSESGNFADSEIDVTLGRILKRCAERIVRVGGDPALIVVLRDPPHSGSSTTWWHVRLSPRTSTPAGFELATDVRIMPRSPESCAEALRGAM